MTSAADPPKADCYSAGERGAMYWWQGVRAQALRPLLVFAKQLGIRPDHITLVSLVSGLLFCPLWLWPGQPAWTKIAALLALLMHAVLDELDGPLARHLRVASRRGSFTDTLADQIVVTASALAIMAAPAPTLNIWIGFSYTRWWWPLRWFAMQWAFRTLGSSARGFGFMVGSPSIRSFEPAGWMSWWGYSQPSSP